MQSHFASFIQVKRNITSVMLGLTLGLTLGLFSWHHMVPLSVVLHYLLVGSTVSHRYRPVLTKVLVYCAMARSINFLQPMEGSENKRTPRSP